MTHAIGVDVGGTKIAAMRLDDRGTVHDRATVPTLAQDGAAVVRAIIDVVGRLRTGDVEMIGIGAPGLVDREENVRYAPNLAWRDFPLGARVQESVRLPCIVENDATMAVWGEHRVGAARDADHVLLIAAGTGIGGGVIINGRLHRGAHGFAGEIGHVIVDPDGPLCGCGNKGCWEQFASGRAITRAGREAVREYPLSVLAAESGGDPERVDGVLVTNAALAGDDVARGILAAVGRRLGRGAAGLVNVLDPEVVVVGGGVIAGGELLLGPARRAFADAIEGFDHRPNVPLVAAELGNDAGAVGAGLLAIEELAP